MTHDSVWNIASFTFPLQFLLFLVYSFMIAITFKWMLLLIVFLLAPVFIATVKHFINVFCKVPNKWLVFINCTFTYYVP